MTDNYAVFGNPVAHSRSPDIHTLFAAQTGQDMFYGRQLVAEGGFQFAATNFFAGGGKGLNITVPFKVDAFEFADQLTERARRAGAVNTLACLTDGNILGDNTDGAGLLGDMKSNLGWNLSGKRVLLVGAGGAVRGVLEPLLADKPVEVIIANRTRMKAEKLAGEFSDLGSVCGRGLDELGFSPFDVVINGTSASLSGELPPLDARIIGGHSCCYDMMYGKEPTIFMSWCHQAGARQLADGLGMLVEQAAESFQLWRGVRPHTREVIDRIRAVL